MTMSRGVNHRSDPASLLAQESLIVEVLEAIALAMEAQSIRQVELAWRLGVGRANVSQIMGGRNISLRSLADIATALGCTVEVNLRSQP